MAKKLSFFLNACVFSLNACVGLVMHRQSLLLLLQVDMGGGTFFKLGRLKCTSKNYGISLWFELVTLTSQALKYDVSNFCQHV